MRRRARILQIAHDISAKPFSQLRVLDLACFEGGFSFEFAARGAQVLGIDGRAENLQAALAERDRLGLANVEFVHDDVRNLSAARYGHFDIALALGIAYHLDAPAVFHLFEHLYEVCTDFAIVDTHVGVSSNRVVTYQGQNFAGWAYTEGGAHDKWASIGNEQSFWLTAPSLYNALTLAGFSSVLEVRSPAMNDIPADRTTVVAMKRERVNLLINPLTESELHEPYAETPLVPAVSERRSVLRRLARILNSA